MKKILLLLNLMVCILLAGHAQPSLAELAEQLSTEDGHAKLQKQGLVRHLYTVTKHPGKYYIEDALKFERVGLITLMVKQNTGVSTELGKSFAMGPAGLQAIATEIESPLVASLKAAGADKGIEVLTPAEFLSSPALVDEYLDMSFEGGAAIAADEVSQALGYRAYDRLTLPGAAGGLGGIKYASYYQLGLLAQKCGLDAMIVAVVNVYPAITNSVDRKLLFYDLCFSNILVNQTPVVEGRKYPKILGGYVACMGGSYSLLSFGGLPILEFDQVGKGEILSEGFQVVPGGGLRSEVTSRPELRLQANYVEDLGKVLGAFAPHYLRATQDFIQASNQKNKLE
ncbi:MAG: hypothetical protein D6722_28005 [Bacteroidetes bacterium]|nr:MAG: hypothetical protein D6722_28005 [Bacteroidota bacterium]